MSPDFVSPLGAEVQIPVGDEFVYANVDVPPVARGLVLFAHGSGSSRHSPRNIMVAGELRRAAIATLLLDLLTPGEESRDAYTREHRFDIALLATRLGRATRWARAHPTLGRYPVGYFGASTGSAAALVAAADLGGAVRAVVSRGGRPDLAGAALSQVTAATLLIVGGADHGVIELNERALAGLSCPKELAIVPGATHLFEEPGTLEQVCALAQDWFARHLGSVGA